MCPVTEPTSASGARRRPRRKRVRRLVVVGLLLVVLAIGGQQLAVWSGAPAAAKDCVVQSMPAPASATSTPAATTNKASSGAPYPGFLAQQGGSVNDASCLNRIRVYGVVRPRTVADVREALAFAEKHDLIVSIAGTQHAMGGQASYPGALVLDMRGMDAISVDETA